ncbi:MAG: hypothetical protein QXD49_04320 [Archaeoglobaceae archaeon]
MKFDEILEKAVKEVSKEYGIPEEKIWKAIVKFKLKNKIRVE